MHAFLSRVCVDVCVYACVCDVRVCVCVCVGKILRSAKPIDW
jgi:hypothetical protein